MKKSISDDIDLLCSEMNKVGSQKFESTNEYKFSKEKIDRLNEKYKTISKNIILRALNYKSRKKIRSDIKYEREVITSKKNNFNSINSSTIKDLSNVTLSKNFELTNIKIELESLNKKQEEVEISKKEILEELAKIFGVNNISDAYKKVEEAKEFVASHKDKDKELEIIKEKLEELKSTISVYQKEIQLYEDETKEIEKMQGIN